MRTDAERRERFEAVAGIVFEPLQRYLHRRARAEDAADVLNDTMLVIWRRLDDVPADAPLPWSYGVARRCLANHRRSDDRHLRLVEKATSQRVHLDDGDPQQAFDGRDERLVAALATLTAGEAEIVRLWAWERLEPIEIATVLDMTANAVSVALSRSKRKLRVQLDPVADRQDRPPAGQMVSEADDERGRSQR